MAGHEISDIITLISMNRKAVSKFFYSMREKISVEIIERQIPLGGLDD